MSSRRHLFRCLLQTGCLFGLTFTVVLPASLANGSADERGSIETGKLHDITGPEEIPTDPPGPFWPFLVGLGLLLTGSAIMGGWLVLRRSRREPELPPELWALRELERLEKEGLPEAGLVERFHTVASDVIRRYLEMRYQLQAPRQTTHEFLNAVRRSVHLGPSEQTLLREFLEQCDLAKFARAGFSAGECKAAAEKARRLIELGEKKRSDPEPAFPANAAN